MADEAEAPAVEQPPAEEPPPEQPPVEQPPAEQPPAEQPAADQSPAEQPSAEQPSAEEPPAEQSPHVRVQVPQESKQGLTKSEGDIKKGSLDRTRYGSVRQSTSVSKEGILRRHSDRPSKARIAVGSVIIFGKGSGYGDYATMGKIPRYMNTYKLDSDHPFHVEKVEAILNTVLREALNNLAYDPDKCAKQAKAASNAIRSRVKEQAFDRYRIISVVTIGEKRYHDMCSVIRFLWDIERDKYAFCVQDNMHVFAAALCFGVYFD